MGEEEAGGGSGERTERDGGLVFTCARVGALRGGVGGG